MQRVMSICLVLCMLCATEAGAQAIANGVLTGTVVSREGTIAGTGTIAGKGIIYTTPATGHFVLTQVGCSRPAGVLVSVTKFGPLGLLDSRVVPQILQLTFSPGLALPSGASVQFTFNYIGVENCYMTGVLGP
jgi:hypothetical protein